MWILCLTIHFSLCQASNCSCFMFSNVDSLARLTFIHWIRKDHNGFYVKLKGVSGSLKATNQKLFSMNCATFEVFALFSILTIIITPLKLTSFWPKYKWLRLVIIVSILFPFTFSFHNFSTKLDVAIIHTIILLAIANKILNLGKVPFG